MTLRIAVITDAHANLSALRAALEAIQAEGCDLIFHTGDAIAIGPQPRECLDLLLGTRNTRFVQGNHESYFVDGVPQPQPAWMSNDEVEHQHWTHAQLDPAWRDVLAEWPYIIEQAFAGVWVTFCHYALASSARDFAPFMRQQNVADLDRLFTGSPSQLIFYGHDHRASDLQGRVRYINPGSLGCQTLAVAPYCLVDFYNATLKISHRRVSYDDAELTEPYISPRPRVCLRPLSNIV